MNTLANGKITDIRELKKIAKKIRINILHMLTRAGSVHTGGSLSAADVSVAIYFSKMKFDPANPKWEERDRYRDIRAAEDCRALRSQQALSGRDFPLPLEVCWGHSSRAGKFCALYHWWNYLRRQALLEKKKINSLKIDTNKYRAFR